MIVSENRRLLCARATLRGRIMLGSRKQNGAGNIPRR